MTAINAKPEILEIKISEIIPWSENPREIEREALNGLRASLERFGYVDLLIINKRNMQLISGHQRLKILQDSGIETVTCIMVDVDEMMQKAMAVTLNNKQITGYFTEALMPIMEELRRQLPDEYLNLRLRELREECEELEREKSGNTLPDDIPPLPKEAVTRPGDMWILGDHRLLCGDSTNPEHVARLMDGQKAKLFATDPPYLIDYTGKNRPGDGGRDWTDVYHEIDIEDAEGFMVGFLKTAMEHIEPSAAFYLWHADRRAFMIQHILDQLDILVHQKIVWVKPASLLTFSVYPWRHEPCMFGWRKGHKPFFRSSRKQIGSVWEISVLRSGDPSQAEYYGDIWYVDWDGKKRNSGLEHPTVKPVEIFGIPMRVHTSPGDICYEPFSGSGSQIIAAERLNRRCFAMELEPVFCDVAVRRWEEFTGKKAVKS